MNSTTGRTLSLVIFFSIFVLGSAHPIYSDELAPGYNQCNEKVESRVDKLSNKEIREEVGRCLENAEKYWQKRLLKVLRANASSENDFFKDNKARMQEAVKNFKKSFESYKEATSIFLSHMGHGVNTAPDELGIKTLSDFVLALENFYK